MTTTLILCRTNDGAGDGQPGAWVLGESTPDGWLVDDATDAASTLTASQAARCFGVELVEPAERDHWMDEAWAVAPAERDHWMDEAWAVAPAEHTTTYTQDTTMSTPYPTTSNELADLLNRYDDGEWDDTVRDPSDHWSRWSSLWADRAVGALHLDIDEEATDKASVREDALYSSDQAYDRTVVILTNGAGAQWDEPAKFWRAL